MNWSTACPQQDAASKLVPNTFPSISGYEEALPYIHFPLSICLGKGLKLLPLLFLISNYSILI